MCIRDRAGSDAQIALSITGVAGPGGTPQKPEGMVCFGLALGTPDQIEVQNETCQFGALGRAQVRAESVNHALEMLQAALL